jgi:hypothetical protein
VEMYYKKGQVVLPSQVDWWSDGFASLSVMSSPGFEPRDAQFFANNSVRYYNAWSVVVCGAGWTHASVLCVGRI